MNPDRATCLLCYSQATQFDLIRGKHIESKHPEDVTGLVCSKCVQRLLSAPQDKIEQAYQLALDRGLTEKAKILENFLEEGQIVGETRESKRDMVRKGALREIRTSHHQIRPKRATRQLDKRRVAVR